MKYPNPNVSPIYLEAARSYLARRYPMMMPSIREDLLMSGTFQELEAYTEIASTLRVVIITLHRELANFGIYFPKKRLNIVLHDKCAKATLRKTRNKIKKAHLHDTEVGKILCTAAKAAHDHRVRFYSSPTAPEKELLDFLPAELLGWDKFSENLIFVEPITKALGIDIMPGYIRDAYHDKVDGYLERNSIHSKLDLKHHLEIFKYHALPASVLSVIRTERSAMDRMTNELVNRPGSTLQRFNPYSNVI